MAEMPEYMTELGYEVGRLDAEEIINRANEAGKNQFGIDGIVRFFFLPYLYLDETKISKAKLKQADVERIIATAISDSKGIALAVPRSGVATTQTSPAVEQIQRNFHPTRSGDIYIAQQPYWFMFESGPIAVMHGSPWKYDTHVPIIFAGAGIDDETVHRLVHPVDVAPTIANLLGMTSPSSATGSPLEEVVK